ncbi:hypothetical protein ACLB2K_026543 [Fragaria x ananassa]
MNSSHLPPTLIAPTDTSPHGSHTTTFPSSAKSTRLGICLSLIPHHDTDHTPTQIPPNRNSERRISDGSSTTIPSRKLNLLILVS